MDTLVCFCWLLSPYKDLHAATNLLNFSFYIVSISFQTHKQILIGGKKKSSFLALLQTSTFKKNLCRQQSQLPYPDFLVYARSGGGPPLPCFVLKLCFFFLFLDSLPIFILSGTRKCRDLIFLFLSWKEYLLPESFRFNHQISTHGSKILVDHSLL